MQTYEFEPRLTKPRLAKSRLTKPRLKNPTSTPNMALLSMILNNGDIEDSSFTRALVHFHVDFLGIKVTRVLPIFSPMDQWT